MDAGKPVPVLVAVNAVVGMTNLAKSILFIIIIFATCSLSLAQSYNEIPACKNLLNKFEEKLASSRQCEKVEDCISLAYGCPFGCGTAASKGTEGNLQKIVDEFNEQCPRCAYRCANREYNLKCVQSQCILEPGKWR